jgi:hypothetical protein
MTVVVSGQPTTWRISMADSATLFVPHGDDGSRQS